MSKYDRTSYKWWTNSQTCESKRFLESPGDGWVPGRNGIVTRKKVSVEDMYPELSDQTSDCCVPAKNRNKNKNVITPESARKARMEARRVLCDIAGSPPFEKAVCRHLCENDSMMPNGFICVKHIEWATQKENAMDASEKMSKAAKKRYKRDGSSHYSEAGKQGAEARWGKR